MSGYALSQTATFRRPGATRRGRKQHRYHALFREVRERTKYEHVVAFADALPAIREKVQEHLALFPFWGRLPDRFFSRSSWPSDRRVMRWPKIKNKAGRDVASVGRVDFLGAPVRRRA